MRWNHRRAGATGASVLFLASVSAARAGAVSGGYISATGSAPTDGSNENLTYQIDQLAGTTFRTWQYLGGTNAAGDAIPGGGLDTEIEVFNSSNASVDYNDDIGPGNRDSMLSDTGTGVTFMPPIGPGQFRLKLNKLDFTDPGSGRWALDAVRPTTPIKLVARTGFNSNLQSLKFGAISWASGAPASAEVTVTGATQDLAVGSVEVRGGGALRVSNGTFTPVFGRAANGGLAELTGGTLNILSTMHIEAGGSISFAGGYLNGGTLDVNGGQLIVSAGGNKLLRAAQLSITNSGTVDLADNDARLTATPQASVIANIVAARNGGAWNGSGLTSSAAAANANHTTTLGVLSGAEYLTATGTSTFAGQATSAGDTLVKYTWNGDANVDGRVTFDDYVKIDTGFNTHLTGWLNGDFNYSGTVNFDDYVLIDIAFNQQNSTLARAIDWISGDDRSKLGLNGGVETVIDHFDQFGASYGAAFLAAVPEPSAATALLATPWLLTMAPRGARRKSNTSRRKTDMR